MEEGILDVNIPMNYKDESNAKNAQQYRNWLNGFKRWRYDRQVYTGLDFNQPVGDVMRQIEAARKRGIDGMVGFSFNQTENRLKLVQALKYGIYSELAVAPELSWKLKAVYRQSRERYAQAIDAATIGQNVDQAIELLNSAIRLDPRFTNAHFHLGKCYLRKEMYEDAIKQFEEVLAIDPDYAAAKEEIVAARSETAKETSETTKQGLLSETNIPEGGN
jgi:tetratricopeptide (TPR) repeat protein